MFNPIFLGTFSYHSFVFLLFILYNKISLDSYLAHVVFLFLFHNLDLGNQACFCSPLGLRNLVVLVIFVLLTQGQLQLTALFVGVLKPKPHMVVVVLVIDQKELIVTIDFDLDFHLGNKNSDSISKLILYYFVMVQLDDQSSIVKKKTFFNISPSTFTCFPF